jgi:hypothetical protein
LRLMDTFEAARLKHAKNKERFTRTRKPEEKAEVVFIEKQPEVREPILMVQKTSLGEGDIAVILKLAGREHQLKFNAPLMGNVSPSEVQQALLEALTFRFGLRVKAL